MNASSETACAIARTLTSTPTSRRISTAYRAPYRYPRRRRTSAIVEWPVASRSRDGMGAVFCGNVKPSDLPQHTIGYPKRSAGFDRLGSSWRTRTFIGRLVDVCHEAQSCRSPIEEQEAAQGHKRASHRRLRTSAFGWGETLRQRPACGAKLPFISPSGGRYWVEKLPLVSHHLAEIGGGVAGPAPI